MKHARTLNGSMLQVREGEKSTSGQGVGVGGRAKRQASRCGTNREQVILVMAFEEVSKELDLHVVYFRKPSCADLIRSEGQKHAGHPKVVTHAQKILQLVSEPSGRAHKATRHIALANVLIHIVLRGMGMLLSKMVNVREQSLTGILHCHGVCLRR